MPFVAGQDAGVDEDDAGQRIGVAHRPEQPDRPAEVVENEMDALDPERLERLADEGRVALRRVLEAGRGEGLAEVGQVEGDGSGAGRAGRRDQRLPVVGGARVAVDEDQRLRGVGGTGLHEPRLGAAGLQPRALHGGAHPAAVGAGRSAAPSASSPPRLSACRALT